MLGLSRLAHNVRYMQTYHNLHLEQARPMAKNLDHFYDLAARHVPATGGFLKVIRMPELIYKTTLPLVKDNGSLDVIEAFRVIHSDAFRPTKGGLVIDESVTQDEMETLAAVNSFRFALADIPWGGAKGGIKIKKSNYTARQIHRICRLYAGDLINHGYLGPSQGLVSPDYGCDQPELGAILYAYRNARPYDVNQVAMVTGKSVEQGGLRGADRTFGKGFRTGIEECVRFKAQSDPEFGAQWGKGFSFNGLSVTLQGFGYVGKQLALDIVDAGGVVTTIIEKDGAVHNPSGIDVNAAIAYISSNASLQGLSNTHPLSEKAALSKQVDLFIPAAKENVITMENVHLLNCKIYAEAAVNPTTPDAEKYLEDHNVFVIPDLCVVPAADFIHYVEWLKGLTHIRYGRMEKRYEQNFNEKFLTYVETLASPIEKSLRRVAAEGPNEATLVSSVVQEGMSDIARQVSSAAHSENLNYRTAAMKIAITRIANVYKSQGVFP